jgi:hypothetical protein
MSLLTFGGLDLSRLPVRGQVEAELTNLSYQALRLSAPVLGRLAPLAHP